LNGEANPAQADDAAVLFPSRKSRFSATYTVTYTACEKNEWTYLDNVAEWPVSALGGLPDPVE
jgi:hypothetical protein